MLRRRASFESLEQLQVIYKQAKTMLEKGLMNTGFSLRQWEILKYIDQHGQTSVCKLASVFGVTRALISKHVGYLMKQDLLWSQEDLTDRRNKRLILTLNGQSEVRKAEQQIIVNIRKFKDVNEFSTLAEQVIILEQYLVELDYK